MRGDRDQVLAGRWVLERRLGQGGMGEVWSAWDRRTNERVALKILTRSTEVVRARLEREARAMDRVAHPHVRRLLSLGKLQSGEPILVMQYLEGTSFAEYLDEQQRALGLVEAARLLAPIFSAVGTAHAHGVFHRDIKPQNLFIEERDARPYVLDFGIAKLLEDHAPAGPLTQSGAFIGTPSFMAPEQLFGERDVDHRADIWALGLVAYQCLTGTLPTRGARVGEVLRRVLCEPIRPIGDLRRDLPGDLCQVIDGMLERDRRRRVADLIRTTELLALHGGVDVPRFGEPRSARGGGTAQSPRATNMSVTIDVLPDAAPTSAPLSVAPATVEDPPFSEQAPRSRLTAEEVRVVGVVLFALGSAAIEDASATQLAGIARDFGSPEIVGERLLGVVVDAKPTALDLAVEARACARALVAVRPGGEAWVGIVRLPWGAPEPLALWLREASARASVGGGQPGQVHLDESSATLLANRFALSMDGLGAQVMSTETGPAQARVDGPPAPSFVGREREVGLVLSLIEESAGDRVPRAALVLGVPGVGKSRLLVELQSRLEAARPDVQVWSIGADPMRAHSAHFLAGRILRRAARVERSAPPEAIDAAVRRLARAMLGPACGELALEALADVAVGREVAPVRPDAKRRQDDVVHGDRVRHAFELLVSRVAEARPVVLFLDDLQWADISTIELLARILRHSSEIPLCVVAFARADCDASRCSALEACGALRVPLAALGRPASERLARALLPAGTPDHELRVAVERASGNPFFLEQIARVVGEGHEGNLPTTILAVVQTRLDAAGGQGRRLLRAASIYGASFWIGAVCALLPPEEDWAAHLEDCVARDLVVASATSRFAGEQEYRFRHAVLVETAYLSLTEADRARGHRRAVEWLEQAGEGDAATLAAHLDRAGDQAAAARYRLLAAEQCLAGNDFAGAERHALAGIDAARDPALCGALSYVVGEARGWSGSHVEACVAARVAVAQLPPGSVRWFAAHGLLAIASSYSGGADWITSVERVREAEPEPDALVMHAVVAARLAVVLSLRGRHGDAEALKGVAERQLARAGSSDPGVHASLARASGFAAEMDGDLEGSLVATQRAMDLLEAAGEERQAAMERANLAFAYIELGRYDQAQSLLHAALATAERMSLSLVKAQAFQNLGLALARQGRYLEAYQAQISCLSALDDDVSRTGVYSQLYLAEALSGLGDFARALHVAEVALGHARTLGAGEVLALATLATVTLAQGEVARSLTFGSEAMMQLSSGRVDEGDTLAKLTWARALELADDARAAEARQAARAHVLQRAARIVSPELRESFLAAPLHRAVLALADG